MVEAKKSLFLRRTCKVSQKRFYTCSDIFKDPIVSGPGALHPVLFPSDTVKKTTKEMHNLCLLPLYCFTISRRNLLSKFLITASGRPSRTKMEAATSKNSIRILLHGGDNMLGRAVQLSFPVQAPGEEFIRDSCTAKHYLNMCLDHPSGSGKDDATLEEIRLLNANHGSYLWGDYRCLSITPPPDLKILNLETAVSKSINNPDLPLWKGIRYHLHSDNYDNVMTGFCQETHGRETPSPVIVNFANNHGMDYGRQAMEQECLPLLQSLQTNDFQAVGIGMNWNQASKPASLTCKSTPIQVFAFSSGCSGTPPDWWATETRSGLVGLPALYCDKDVEAAKKIAKQAFAQYPSSGDGGALLIVSIHWGPNWARKHESREEIAARRKFAHWLIDECDVDLIYGHSSHHARGIELYNDKLMYVRAIIMSHFILSHKLTCILSL